MSDRHCTFTVQWLVVQIKVAMSDRHCTFTVQGYLKSNKATHTVKRATFAGRILRASVSGHHYETHLAHILVHA